MTYLFPKDFTWGVATSSYQIEGAAHQDGRGASIWDTFAETPGKVKGGATGEVACDHYNRYPEDLDLIKSMGVGAYRFSIAWSRLFPNGDTAREERGFDFYNRLINSLLDRGIEPIVTLYHWDLPQSLEDLGGWANREIVTKFEYYAKACAEAFGDRVTKWITINEPWCVSWLGYSIGVHAPGKKDYKAAIAAAHHTALAHAVGMRAIKKVRPDAQVGITLNMTNYINESPDDPTLPEVIDLLDANLNRWWIEACETGEYPKTLLEAYGNLSEGIILQGDCDLLRCRIDFLGVNYYSDSFVDTPRPEDTPFIANAHLPINVRANTSIPERFSNSLTDIGWPMTPDGIERLLSRVHRDWPEIPAIYITENGCAINDGPTAGGEISDSRRVDYLVSHLQSLNLAIQKDVPVKGYFAWSLLDNFEWAEGYTQRFGMIHVDFQTQKRTFKESGHAYKKIVESGIVIP